MHHSTDMMQYVLSIHSTDYDIYISQYFWQSHIYTCNMCEICKFLLTVIFVLQFYSLDSTFSMSKPITNLNGVLIWYTPQKHCDLVANDTKKIILLGTKIAFHVFFSRKSLEFSCTTMSGTCTERRLRENLVKVETKPQYIVLGTRRSRFLRMPCNSLVNVDPRDGPQLLCRVF